MNPLAMGLGRSGRYHGSGMDALARGWCRSGLLYDSDMDALAMGWGRSTVNIDVSARGRNDLARIALKTEAEVQEAPQIPTVSA